MENDMEYIIVGCGISGAVIARELAEKGHSVKVYDRRSHIAGNMYDYVDGHGILVQLYGPHIFHTSSEEVFEYITKYASWNDYKLVCGAVWDNKYTPSPFNFETLDVFFEKNEAEKIKDAINEYYCGKDTATVLEMLEHENKYIRKFAEYLFEKDYAPYTAKQWGMDPKDVDPNVLKRVPIRLNYKKGYFSDKYEMMPSVSFASFVENILNHSNIETHLNSEAKRHLSFRDDVILWDGVQVSGKIIYTGPIDELFDCMFGKLPYRSLKFEWRYSEEESIQEAPVVAYPQADGYTRITEFKKLPVQRVKGSTYALEYPLTYVEGDVMEPYYPVSTKESEEQVCRYREKASTYKNLVLCGRLANFKYYNMDQAIENALKIAQSIV